MDILFNLEEEEREFRELNAISATMNATQYKHYHENYMKNNPGTTAYEPFLSIYFTVLCTLYVCVKDVRYEGWRQYVYEYGIIVLPMVAINTICFQYLAIIVATVTVMIALDISSQFSRVRFVESFTKLNKFSYKRFHSISCLRGLTYLITVFAVLAVDFRSFPKGFAKTWKFGYSLMDTGTGLFILMSGIVHKNVSNETIDRIVLANIKFIMVIIALGLGRYGAVHVMNYQEQVQEYGVHWNFFYTLGTCKIFALVLLYIGETPLFFAILTLTVHELLLGRWKDFILDFEMERDEFISQNKEGICSCLGYVSLYLFGYYVRLILNNEKLTRYMVLMRFLIMGLVSFAVLCVMNEFRPISRVMANTSYCMYILTLLAVFLSLLYCFEVLFEDKGKNLRFETPQTLTAVNENGLLFFVISNLVTGIINKSMRTLFVPAYTSFFTINFYMMFVVYIIVNLKNMDFII